jgi:long-chain acyl-CoA synthetase
MADTNLAQMFFDRARVDGAADAYLVRQGAAFSAVSWAQAAERVEVIAAGVLKGAALTPGACVTIMANTRLEWILADWALMSLGFRTVPIYVSLLAPEVGYIHADTAGGAAGRRERGRWWTKVRRRARASSSTTRSTRRRR